jgi:SLT domain-containing protein
MAGIGGGGGGGGIGGLFGDVIGGLVGGLFGGGLTADPFPGTTGRARGGRVYAGRAYTVGERGREWFTPDENGFVGAAASGGMIVNIDARGATRDAIAGIRRELRALNASVERRVDARVMDSRRRGGDFGRTLK